MARPLQCYVSGHDDNWSAICLDLDIMVNGRAKRETMRLLEEAIGTYLDAIRDEAPEVRRRLLYRRSPWRVRAMYAISYNVSNVLRTFEHLVPQSVRQHATKYGYFAVPCQG